MKTINEYWLDTIKVLPKAHAIAFDGCHKIYVLMDDEQVADSLRTGYGTEAGTQLIETADLTPDAMLAQLQAWFEKSCSLRFVSAVTTKPDPNEGYHDLIPQGASEESK